MQIAPIIISLAALGISILSFIISLYRAAVDRRLQWEQMRGSALTRLTFRGVELLTLIEDVRFFPGNDQIEQLKDQVVLTGNTIEQLKGEAELTEKTVDQLKEQAKQLGEEIVSMNKKVALVKKLVRICKGIIHVRQTLMRMEAPPRFRSSKLIMLYAPIQTELDDTEPVFDKLKSEITQLRFSEASQTADGLLARFYGKDKNTRKTELEPPPTAHT